MPRVLIVDDEAHLRDLYEQEFDYYGYDVVTAQSGQEAIAALEQHDVDVVVLDIAMPGMDGIEALAKILAVNNELPVILNTGYASYKDDFMTWAAEAYVTKSSDIRELVDAVAEALKKRGIEPPEPPEDK
ncbi:MAG: response regulator [Armatimonadetes bacterium]|nr:response regulator [Armatimonadota bacterium]